MGKRSTIIAITAIAILLGCIAFAVTRLYRPASGGGTDHPASTPVSWSVLSAVPSDAVAVLVFDGSARASRIIADSTGILRGIVASDNPAFMHFLQSLGNRRIAVSLHNSGSLVPLVAAEASPADSALAPQAAKAGLKTMSKDGFFLASRSETFLNSSARHLDEDKSILGAKGLTELIEKASGPAVMLVSHSHAGKLLQVYAGKPMHSYTSFVKDLTAWSAWMIQDGADDGILVKGITLPGEGVSSYFADFALSPSSVPSYPEVLPYFTSSAISVPVADADAYIEGRRSFEDGRGRRVRFDKFLTTRAGRPLTPTEWLRSIQPREVVKAVFTDPDGVDRSAVLVRSGKDLKLGREASNPYRGCLGQFFGEAFDIVDTSCASIGEKWTVYADLPTVRAFQDKEFLKYSLKDRLQDASVNLPSGFNSYLSLSDAPLVAGNLFSKAISTPVLEYVKGSGYAPAFAALDLSSEFPSFRIQLDKRALKGTKVQVLERDTTVVIPTGLFPVTNYQSGKTNYLYQNSHLSICLNDENGKGVWGIPFKEPICGRVQDIDYYNNKKIQFLFAAGSKLYALDRLGHWVNGFPVELGKPILLGPDAYDFTGAGGYTVMVLHKDNTLERYNLHGVKPEGWKGINAPEKVKNLPELIESGEKRYWAVRTSVRTLIYPFEGGEPLTKDEGGKMLKPDTPLTPTSKGVSAECYDGKTRDIKLK